MPNKTMKLFNIKAKFKKREFTGQEWKNFSTKIQERKSRNVNECGITTEVTSNFRGSCSLSVALVAISVAWCSVCYRHSK